jgi:hypothetical protein
MTKNKIYIPPSKEDMKKKPVRYKIITQFVEYTIFTDLLQDSLHVEKQPGFNLYCHSKDYQEVIIFIETLLAMDEIREYISWPIDIIRNDLLTQGKAIMYPKYKFVVFKPEILIPKLDDKPKYTINLFNPLN